MSNTDELTPRKLKWIVAGLFLLALSIRSYDLFESPGFFEGKELQVTLDLVHGTHFPLYNQNPHIGAFANYLIAAFFELFGLHWWIPRVVIVLMGALTIPITFLLGRRLTDTRTALLGSIFMAFCMYHALLLSHVPWSNCMSPLFSAASSLCFVKAAQTRKVLWMGLGGLFFGIALQTHPSLITLALPIILIFLFFGDAPWRTRIWSYAPLLALAGAVVGYANMIYYNVAHRMGSVTFGMQYPTYALQRNPQITTYVRNLKNAGGLMLRLISGGAEVKSLQPFNWLTLMVLLAGVMLLAGLAVCLYNKSWALPVLFLLPFLTIPIFNRSYELCQFGRYLGFLLVPAYLLMARAMILIFDLLRSRVSVVAYSFLILLSALFITAEADQLHKLSTEMKSRNASMIVYRETASLLRESGMKGYPLLVDRGSWKASNLITFLQTDGWDAQPLHGTSWKEEKRMLAGEFVADAIYAEVKGVQKQHGNVVAIVSPNILLTLMRTQSIDTCLGCLSVQDERRPVRNLLSKTLYFLVTPPAPDSHNETDPLLAAMNVLITESDSHVRHSHTPHITSQLQKSCKVVKAVPTKGRTEICKAEKDPDDDGDSRTHHRHGLIQ
jgi:hypothetical protein